ncbi:MAG: YjcZ family sporulation protein [Acholeplasmatales bacterium]|nr:YjcZ family sporulation protein [Acholeplasmatales bacterium]
MFYQTPGYGYSCGCQMPMYNQCCNNNRRGGQGYALILVLFILLVIIGAARW